MIGLLNRSIKTAMKAARVMRGLKYDMARKNEQERKAPCNKAVRGVADSFDRSRP